jgi:hypothetical protein
MGSNLGLSMEDETLSDGLSDLTLDISNGEPEMTEKELRDDLAKTAMQIILAHEWPNMIRDEIRSVSTELETCSEYAYELADFMMKVRKK